MSECELKPQRRGDLDPIGLYSHGEKNHVYDFIGSYYYTYKDAIEQETRWSVEVCHDVMKQKSPPGSESHVSSPYSHYTD